MFDCHDLCDIYKGSFRQYFGQFGNITEVLQLYHRDTDRKKGVGLITFDDEDAVDKIVLIGAHIIKGRAIEAQKAITEKSMNDMKAGYDESVTKATDPTDRVMRRLFIRRLPQNTTVEELNEHSPSSERWWTQTFLFINELGSEQPMAS